MGLQTQPTRLGSQGAAILMVAGKTNEMSGPGASHGSSAGCIGLAHFLGWTYSIHKIDHGACTQEAGCGDQG